MEYDIYDFDKTVYPYDSETVFLFYSMLTHPALWFLIPYQTICITLYALGAGDKFKGKCFVFLRFTNGEKLVEKFWKSQSKNIYPIFEKEKRGFPTLVCSASPEYLIKPICEKYGVEKVIATKADIRNGKIIGKNCIREEKVRRIKEELPDAVFRRVISDDLKNDVHIFRLGKECRKAEKGKTTKISIEEIEAKNG